MNNVTMFLKKTPFAGLAAVLLIGLLVVSCDQPANDDGALKNPVNARAPAITAQPQGGTWDVDEEDTFPLTVTANSADGGNLSYQWYENTTNSAAGGAAIGGDDVTLTLNKVDYDADDTLYFYVVVTNTIANNGDGGKKTAAVTSSVATVTITSALVNAKHPSITDQPQGGTWDVSSANSFTLTVTATSPDDGELSFQWYKNSTNSATGGAAIGGDDATLTLAKGDYTDNGDYYFYVVVTNTIDDNDDGGTKTATVTSSVVTVTVSGNVAPAVHAQAPSITAQPTGGFWNIWLPASHTKNTANLTVTAASPDGGNLSYQWYIDSTLLTGKTSATLTLTPAELAAYSNIYNGTRSFSVEVTNTNNNAAGTKTASARSSYVNVTLDGVATGLIGRWVENSLPEGQDDFIITPQFHMTSTGEVSWGSVMVYQGYIQYVSFFNNDSGVIIVKYDAGHEQEWWSGSAAGDYFGIYIELESGVLSKILNTNDSYGPSEAESLEAAIAKFDENGKSSYYPGQPYEDYHYEKDNSYSF